MTGPVVVALAIRDAVLADRVAALLADVPGLRLAAPGEPADVTVTSHPAIPAAAPSDDSVGLTPRGTEVLALLAEGASNKLIARRLGISVHTAKFHVGSLLDKLDATGRTDAVAHAARLGVIRLWGPCDPRRGMTAGSVCSQPWHPAAPCAMSPLCRCSPRPLPTCSAP